MENMAFELMEATNTFMEELADWENYKADMATDPYNDTERGATMNWNDMYDILHESVGASKEALDLAFGIKGCSEETARDILWYYTCYSDFDQYLEAVAEEEDCFDELFNLDEGFDPYMGCYTDDC